MLSPATIRFRLIHLVQLPWAARLLPISKCPDDDSCSLPMFLALARLPTAFLAALKRCAPAGHRAVFGDGKSNWKPAPVNPDTAFRQSRHSEAEFLGRCPEQANPVEMPVPAAVIPSCPVLGCIRHSMEAVLPRIILAGCPAHLSIEYHHINDRAVQSGWHRSSKAASTAIRLPVKSR